MKNLQSDLARNIICCTLPLAPRFTKEKEMYYAPKMCKCCAAQCLLHVCLCSPAPALGEFLLLFRFRFSPSALIRWTTAPCIDDSVRASRRCALLRRSVLSSVVRYQTASDFVSCALPCAYNRSSVAFTPIYISRR